MQANAPNLSEFSKIGSSGSPSASPVAEGGNYLVLVRAQVMTRDDSSGGWVPMGGGGLSYVSVRKRILPAEDESKHEYVICGKRINDQVGVLSCTIKKDFEYNKVMPTFHHWRTGDKKYGLTFQTAADARAFDKGVRVAVEDLEGSLEIHDTDVGDDEVFMAIDLPVERGDSQSSSGSSGGGGVGCGGNVNAVEMLQSPFTHPHANHHYFHRMHYITRSTARTSPTSNNNNKGVNSGSGVTVHGQQDHQRRGEVVVVPPEVWVSTGDDKQHQQQQQHHRDIKDVDKIEILSEPYSYVQFARDRPSVHEYSYPMVDSVKGGGAGGGDAAAKKLRGGDVMTSQQQLQLQQQQQQQLPPTLLPIKSKWTRHRDKKRDKLKHLLLDRSRCKHCHEMFNEDENERGSCEYAPDPVRSCIGAFTCLSCAQCMLYHCMSDAEGDFAQHPCSCDRADGHCTRRWFGLAILSIFVPCLWCYLPMSTCHRCGVGYGVCGGRHEAS